MTLRRTYSRRDFIAGATIPWWLGYSYREYHLAQYIYYPLGVNLLVRCARMVYLWISKYSDPVGFEPMLLHDYEAGCCVTTEFHLRRVADLISALAASEQENRRLRQQVADDLKALEMAKMFIATIPNTEIIPKV